MDFTYHHHLHHSVAKWIASILPLLQLLVHSFHLKYILLFCRRDLSHSCPFSPIIKAIQEALPLWYLSTNEFLAHEFGAGIRGCRSFLYLLSTLLPTTFLFPPSSDLIFPCYLPCLSSVFNSPSFSLITTTNLSSLSQSPTFCPPLTEPRLYVFTKENESIPFSSQHNIYDPTHPVPEPDFPSSVGPFDGWFGSCSCPVSD